MSVASWSNGIDLLTKDRSQSEKLFDLMTDRNKIDEVRKARGYHPRWVFRMMERNNIDMKAAKIENWRSDRFKR